jgi:hypothetical protein
MFSASGRPKLSSLGIGIAAYVIGISLTAAAATHVVWRAGAALVQRLAPAADTRHGRELAARTPAARAAMSLPAPAAQSIRREAAMTPLADRWDGRWGGVSGRPQPRVWGSSAPQFGTSARNPSRRYDDEDGPFGSDDRERPVGTYRTVCVRLCDGYYFPISFAVGADRLERDRGVCESRCGVQGRLFVHRNPGGSTEDLQDLAGRPYRQLRTAFLYRTEYVPSCTCQPQPWEQASQDRHRLYALSAAVRKGSKDAAKELQALQAKLKETTKLAARPASPTAANPGDGLRPGTDAAASARATDRAAEIARREDGTYMGLGSGGAPKAKIDPKPDRAPLKSRADGDWARRAFEPAGR